MMKYYDDSLVTLYHGDALDVLRQLPDESAQCCVTSPPYWMLRDYGEPGQLGLEPDLCVYIDKIVEIFREVRRVLNDDGTLWLNLGDSYATGGNGGQGLRTAPEGLKHKNLCGIPWRVAFALQSDGWCLRRDIIWHKPNPMPESATDRPTTAHEYIFLLSKQSKYYYDGDAIKEPVAGTAHNRGRGVNPKANTGVGFGYHPGPRWGEKKQRAKKMRQNPSFSAAISGPVVDRRNKRSVWTVKPKPFLAAHFATFPPDLIKPCVLAGCPPGGTVLDHFVGSGTSCLVSKELGRRSIGIDISAKYLAMAKHRLRQEVIQFQK